MRVREEKEEEGGEKRERRVGEEGKEESVSIMSIHQSNDQSTNQPSHLTENHFELVPLSFSEIRKLSRPYPYTFIQSRNDCVCISPTVHSTISKYICSHTHEVWRSF